MAASNVAIARLQFEASTMRRVLLFCFDTLVVASFFASLADKLLCFCGLLFLVAIE